MKVLCPHCQHGHELVAAPGRHALRCNSCRRTFQYGGRPEAPERGAAGEPDDLAARLGETETNRAAMVDRTIIVPIPEQPPAPPAPPRRRTGTGEFKALSTVEPPERKSAVKGGPPPPPASQAPGGDEAAAPTAVVAFPTRPASPSPPRKEGRLPEDLDAVPTSRISLSGVIPQAERTPRITPDERTVMVRLSAVVPAAAVPVDEVITAPRGIPVPPDEMLTARGAPAASDKTVTARGPAASDETVTARGAPAASDEVVTFRGMPVPSDKEVTARGSAAASDKEVTARGSATASDKEVNSRGILVGPDEVTTAPRGIPAAADEVPTSRGIPATVDAGPTSRAGPAALDEVPTTRGIPAVVEAVAPSRSSSVPADEAVTARVTPALRAEAEAPRPAPAPPASPAKKAPVARRQSAARQGGSPTGGTGSRKALPTRSPALPPLAPLTEQEEESSLALPDTNSLQGGMKLGGYQLLRKIGAGSMGTVWLARQLSLDRDVALKVLRPSYSGDPQFVYRFTQEAFAAAQLVHHNIVQIYDCGSEKKIYFFSMEYVDAESLQSLVNREGRLDPEVAAGYVLQAARGLKFAHDRGMVHRDIKPDNLLLNRNGIVKVADLGLVKRARRAPTLPDNDDAVTEEQSSLKAIAKHPQESAMGTPAYMSPEQVENSSRVDARADIYSLGCTFYHLLTGRPPFMSESVPALMGMHVLEPPVPPEERVRRVPKALSDMVLRMLAKLPEERFQTMGEVIRALEGFLGIEGSVSFSPREEHANLLERSVQGFNRAPWARRRRRLVLSFTALSALASGLVGWRFGPLLGVAVAAFAASTWMASFIVRGLFQKGTLFLRFRQFIFQAPLLTWLVWLLMLGGAGYGLYHFGLIGHAAVMSAGSLLCALIFYVLVDRTVEAERRPFVEEVERMLRSMRLRGLEEGSLRQFVCKYSGEQWEAFYEALFGYDAKLLARERWGRNDRGLIREEHAGWRDPLIRGMDAVEHARQQRRERRQLRMLERKKAKAERGITPATSA
jgi:serine/threonine protein kinase